MNKDEISVINVYTAFNNQEKKQYTLKQYSNQSWECIIEQYNFVNKTPMFKQIETIYPVDIVKFFGVNKMTESLFKQAKLENEYDRCVDTIYTNYNDI